MSPNSLMISVINNMRNANQSLVHTPLKSAENNLILSLYYKDALIMNKLDLKDLMVTQQFPNTLKEFLQL